MEVADQTSNLIQSQYTDTRLTSPSADPITLGAWQGSHWSANVEVTGMARPRKKKPPKTRRKRDSNPGSSALEAGALTTRPTRRWELGKGTNWEQPRRGGRTRRHVVARDGSAHPVMFGRTSHHSNIPLWGGGKNGATDTRLALPSDSLHLQKQLFCEPDSRADMCRPGTAGGRDPSDVPHSLPLWENKCGTAVRGTTRQPGCVTGPAGRVTSHRGQGWSAGVTNLITDTLFGPHYLGLGATPPHRSWRGQGAARTAQGSVRQN